MNPLITLLLGIYFVGGTSTLVWLIIKGWKKK